MLLCQHCLLEDTCWTDTLVGREMCSSERHLQSTKYLIFIVFFPIQGSHFVPKNTPESCKFFELNLSFHLNNPHQEWDGWSRAAVRSFLFTCSLFIYSANRTWTNCAPAADFTSFIDGKLKRSCWDTYGNVPFSVPLKCWILKECDHSHPFI